MLISVDTGIGGSTYTSAGNSQTVGSTCNGSMLGGPQVHAPATPVLAEGQALTPPDTAKGFLTEVNDHRPADAVTTEREQRCTSTSTSCGCRAGSSAQRSAGRTRCCSRPRQAQRCVLKTEDLELGELIVRQGELKWRHALGIGLDAEVASCQDMVAV